MTELMDLVEAQRQGLVDLLEGLDRDQWNAPSLCQGWRVREVVAHITVLPYETPLPSLIRKVVAARGKFDVAADRAARFDAAHYGPHGTLGLLKSNLRTRWGGRAVGAHGMLSHDVIHGLDITEALGLPPVSSAEIMRTVLEGMGPRAFKAMGVTTDPRLEATDVAFVREGAGAVVRGTAKDLLLVVSGRR